MKRDNGERLELTDIAKPYEPTSDERVALKALRTRRKKTPHLKVSENKGVVQLSLAHPDQMHGQFLLMDALATGEVDFYVELLSQLTNASVQGQRVSEQQLNFLIAVIKGIEPQDQLETMLAVQMAVVHMLTMTFARRLNNVDNIPQQDSAERTFNKLARTFAVQVEALKRYRTGGEQKVTVEHVTVNQGGKAIVGNVTHGGRGSPQNQETTS
ncbi:MAG: hypothetical protein Q8S00_04200 [Deltaproteobacteria bacterium]|nr:hypothetical protein [Deltaproteobacteria bacterium]MDZ4344007.1 hypothetical protein [Candidatus Binatia bacterium]